MNMFKNSEKSKKGPWVPPPGRSKRDKSLPKVNKSDTESIPNSSQRPHDESLEVMSVGSNASMDEYQGTLKPILHNMKQEHRVLNLYFMSLRPVSQFLNRFVNNSNVQNTTIKKLINKVEEQLNLLFSCFEELEFSITLLKNSISGNDSTDDFMKTIKQKENLLLKLLECYTDILTVFQVILEEKGMMETTKYEKEQEAFKQHFEAQEKKFFTQSATMKDLERRLSILQSKYSAVEDYNATLEETKVELQKALHYKDAQLKHLSAEINQFSMKQDDEKLVELIEEIKTKALAEKKALKKALKAQKMYIEQKNEALKKSEEDTQEKVKMLFELASQRDRLKVQMTVSSNEMIQMKYQIEEIKSQKLKLQNELDEGEITFKKKLHESEEKLQKLVDVTNEEKLKLEKTIQKLEENLVTTTKELEIVKSSQSNLKESLLQVQNEYNGKSYEEIKNLVSLLKDTKEYFKNIGNSDLGGAGDNLFINSSPNTVNILETLQDINKQILELKQPIVSNNVEKSDLIKQLEDLKRLYKTVSEENVSLQSKIEEIKNNDSPEAYKSENPVIPNAGSNFELELKDKEIQRNRKHVKELELTLEAVREELLKKENQNWKISSLENDLKRKEKDLETKERELSLLEQKKEEESERLLKRTKELQEALDEKTAEHESLQRYVDMLKTSLYNVFGNS